MVDQETQKAKRPAVPLPVAVTVLRPEHAAQYVGLSVPTLARMRVEGTGPEFVQLGHKAIGYLVESCDAWLASRPRFRSTSARDVALTAA